MLNPPAQLRIFLHTQPTDMRKSFDGLAALVRNVFQADPTDGNLFLFVNRRGDRLKILYWDRDGFALWYKRLEAGTFELLRDPAQPTVEIDATQLQLLLSGVSLHAPRPAAKAVCPRGMRRLVTSTGPISTNRISSQLLRAKWNAHRWRKTLLFLLHKVL